jgi:hypothetical protein
MPLHWNGRSRVVIIPLLTRFVARTEGTANAQFLDLEVPELVNLLPHAEDVTLYTLTEQRTPNHEWNIALRSGYTRTFENSNPVYLGPALHIVTNGSVRHPPNSTLANFQLESRVQLMTKNATGVTTFESAVVSATLAVRTYGQ